MNNTYLIDEMKADLLLNHEDGRITILHNKPFTDELMECYFIAKKGHLILKFQHKEQDFGLDFIGEYAHFMENNKTITVLQIDEAANKAVSGLEVPLRIV